MDKLPMLELDTFLVINKTVLHDSDHKVLTMLYQPIIGSLAINLYLTLWSYLDKSEIMSSNWTHRHLIKAMQVKLERIIEAREKLEAMGLLKTYLKEGEVNNYIYELYSPLKVSEFLTDPILSTILYDTVGKTEYQEIVRFYEIPVIDLKDYKDISTKFNDVFMTTSIANVEEVSELKKRNALGIAYEPTIDLNNILSLIPNERLNMRSITKSVKELIYKIALVYNYNDEEMRDLILNSIDDSHKIDLELLKRNARNFYRFETGNKKAELIYKNQPEYLKSKITSTSKKAKQIYSFETTSPYEFLANKNGCELTREETDILNYLLITVNLQPGVVNVLLDYVLNISENKLVKSFIENKATEWKRNNIETVEDAMAMAKKEKNSKKSTNKKTAIVSKTAWFDKNIEGEEASLAEQQAFLEKLKNME